MSIEAERAFLAREKPGLARVEDEALNAETPLALLDEMLTPVERFFVRNNGALPDPCHDPQAWTLTVEGEVARPLTVTLAELKRRFETVTLTAVMECAGNGRAFFEAPVDGLVWSRGAVGCARWTGVRMADVLAACGITDRAVYVAHEAPDRHKGRPALSRGLPLAKALAPETLLAFAMNDAPLTHLHGAPLRVVAPGFPGSAWQKWLTRLWVRDREHDGEKMRGTDYRMPRRQLVPGEPIDPGDFDVITDMPVKSMILQPGEGFEVSAGPQNIAGFAWSGHVPLSRVEVSADAGRSWQAADLEPGDGRFAWQRFVARLMLPTGRVTLAARAYDAAGQSQPPGPMPWNPRGYLNNAVHRVHGIAR
jgi:DMSO/TMAO reductase YedYZ molybdopterin-dependent catalytic subunit